MKRKKGRREGSGDRGNRVLMSTAEMGERRGGGRGDEDGRMDVY